MIHSSSSQWSLHISSLSLFCHILLHFFLYSLEILHVGILFLNSFFCEPPHFFESLTHIFSRAGNCENLSLPNIQISLLNFDYNINQIQARAPCNMPRKELNQSQQQGGQSPFRPRPSISEIADNNQIQNDGRKINKLRNTQRGTQYQPFEQCKGENENKDQSNNLIELNNNRMEEQKASEKLPPFAQLCGEIILKLGQFPIKQQLQKSSLTDQIIDMIEQLDSKKQDQSLEQKISSLNKLFISGVDKKDYFNQDRIQLAGDQGKIIFHPTYLVTGQIIRLLVHQELKKYTISYGHPGIAKTFGYYLYHQLSNLFIAETINRQKQVKQFLQQRNIKQIPKLIYLNMKLETNQFNKEQYLNNLKRSLTKQCPQILKQIKMTQDTANYKAYASKICNFYKERGIQVYLIVDQINFIASKFRIYIQNVKDDKLLKEEQYIIAQSVNKIRIDLMQKGGFSKIIYNSSVNFEYFYVTDNLKMPPLQKQDYDAIMLKLKLTYDYPQQKSIGQCRILYPQITKFDSSIWSLADTIIFEMKRKYQVKNELKDWRSQIFTFLEKRNNSSLTFLRIRKIIQSMEDYDNFFMRFTNEIQNTEQEAYTQNLNNCSNKAFNKIHYLKSLNIIYHKLKQIKQEEDQELMQNKNSQTESTRYLSFLNHPIYCNEDLTPIICLNLDRNLFQPFTRQIKASNFLFQLKIFTVKSIKNWYSLRMSQNQLKQKENKVFNEYKNKISNKLLSSEQKKSVDMVIVTILSSKFLIGLLKNRLSEIDQFSFVDAKQFFADVPQYVIGYYLQRELINYIQKIDSFTFKNEKFSFKYSRNKYFQKLQMKQLPRLPFDFKLQGLLKKRNKGQTADQKISEQTFLSEEEDPFKVQNLQKKARRQYKQFIDQFMDKSRQSGCYLFVPQNSNSKSVDFAIQQIRKNTEAVECNIYLFQVTVVSGKQKISEKIKTFLEAHTYSADYLFTSSKYNQITKPKIIYNINFILIGVPSNEDNMRNAVIQENKSPLFKYISNKNEESKAVLNEIMWVNANKIELPEVEKFYRLLALRDILGNSDIKSKIQSTVRKSSSKKNKNSEENQSSDFEEYC